MLTGSYAIYFISAAAFITVIALLDGFYLLWQSVNLPGRKKIKERIHRIYTSGISREHALNLLRKEHLSNSPALDKFYRMVPRFVHMHRMLDQAALGLSLSKFILIQFFLTISIFWALYLFTKSALLLSIILAIVIGFYLPYLVVRYRCDKRKELFRQLLPDTLDYMARSLRAGNPFSATIKLVSQEMPEPVAEEFGIVFDELNFGLELDQALQGLYERTQSQEIRYFVTAVILQKTTGGNLAEVLNRISTIIRSRASVQKEIMTLAAEMKLSAYVLFALPFVVALALLIINPGYLNVLVEHQLGLIVIGLQIFFMMTGIVIVKKMINFRV